MKRYALAIVLLSMSATACGVEASGLPYYADRTFSPHWSLDATGADHSVVRHVLADTPFLDQRGRPVTPASLAGQAHVASFIFTTCASICPPLVSSLKRVQAQANIPMVSYSIDPSTDTVEVLAQFGRDRGIDPARWALLTGTPDGVRRIARDLYFADDDGLRDIVPEGVFLHSEKVLLVDADGRLRGVYNGTQAFEIDKLLADIATLQAVTGG